LHCPYCGFADSRVTDSRDADDGIRRRRECLSCGERFTTYERVHAAAFVVVKKDGRREDFSRAKLLIGLRKACEKRPLPVGTVEAVADDIEATLQASGKAEVPASIIGEMVMDRLRELDQIAYIRFASVYRDFADIGELRTALEGLAATEARRSQEARGQLTLIPEEALEGLARPWRPVARRRGRGRPPGAAIRRASVGSRPRVTPGSRREAAQGGSGAPLSPEVNGPPAHRRARERGLGGG
jgi:transcriptional repressor NrdR